MVSTPDLTDVITQAAAADAKVILAGDTAAGGGSGAACPCSPAPSATPSSPNPSGSAPPGNKPPAYGSAKEMPACWPSTTSTPGSAAARPSR